MQFGHALQRILQRMYDADPRHGPIYMMKVDIADGFYCMGLAPEDVPSLGVCLPPGPDGRTLVASPLVLPMVWVESPPQFCAVMETVVDLANTVLREQTQRLRMPHRLDQVSESTVPGPDDGLGGIPTTVLCCHGNCGRPRQHSFEGEYSATAHAASTRPGIGLDRTWS